MTLFKTIMGHQTVLRALERDVKEKNLSHATLLTGPEHVGKFHIAFRLAQGLFCETACGHCSSCKLIQAGTHPDVTLLLDDGHSLKIEALRQLIHTVSLSAQGTHRCIVIEHLERMPKEAQNAFLKTLEEPAGNCFFLMTCKDLSSILPTLLSRVRQYRFLTLSHGEIQAALIEEHRLEGPMAEEIVELVQGRPGLALALLHDPALKADYQQLYRQVEQFFTQNNLLAKMQFAETLEKNPTQLKRFFEMAFHYLRKILYQEIQSKPGQKGKISLEQVYDLFESLIKTRYLIGANINKRLALEHFFLQTEK